MPALITLYALKLRFPTIGLQYRCFVAGDELPNTRLLSDEISFGGKATGFVVPTRITSVAGHVSANLELTGAARLYRAAPSDRRERG